MTANERQPVTSVGLEKLPAYMVKELKILPTATASEVPVLSLEEIRDLSTSGVATSHERQQQYGHLLLLRHHLTVQMCGLSETASLPCSVCPELVLERAKVYEALSYADLALADAYVAFSVAAGEEEDLKAISSNGQLWLTEHEDELQDGSSAEDEAEESSANQAGESNGNSSGPQSRAESISSGKLDEVRALIKRYALTIIVRALTDLDCDGEIATWQSLLQGAEDEVYELLGHSTTPDRWTVYDTLEHDCSNSEITNTHNQGQQKILNLDNSIFGLSRREIYPWNEHEPGDRMSAGSLRELNERIFKASDGCLEVRKTMLPTLAAVQIGIDHADLLENDVNAVQHAQPGLFALRELSPHETILREHSVLTATRPHDAPICDACAASLQQSAITTPNDSDSDSRPQQTYACPGCSITFCSKRCLNTALSTYHKPNTVDESTESGYPPEASPFCPGTSAHADLHELGRAESSDAPEWDLYFLLIARCIMMAESRGQHPLNMTEVKWLWGDFSPLPFLATSSSSNTSSTANSRKTGFTRTLPFSMTHSIILPLTFFTTLLLSRPTCAPYSTHWLRHYDFWILQTLFAKFRGVADATQSTWDGKPETAGVYGLWCLANHSCNPNVDWETRGGGEGRRFEVRGERVWSAEKGLKEDEQIEREEWKGIKKGEEIWNHYTDVREDDYRIRRGRLREVLGGDCMCVRCVTEEKISIEQAEKENTGPDS